MKETNSRSSDGCNVADETRKKIEVSYKKILDKINKLKQNTGIDRDIRLIAVSKFQPIEKIQEAIAQGASWFGESYAQELLEKDRILKEKGISNFKWSFIGGLQTNKISKIISVADEIQSVSSLRHIQYISKYAGIYHKEPFPIYIELNLEPQKMGVSFTEVEELARKTQDFKNISLEGIMCVAPIYEENIDIECINKDNLKDIYIPSVYYEIAEFSKKIGKAKLSLGMSSDMISSIIVGSSCVRIGSDIFGERK